jgi:hypothetical protein
LHPGKEEPIGGKKYMNCTKCQGKMYAEKFYFQTGTFQGWRCIACGDIIDPVILLHRVSGDKQIPIPERSEDVIRLIRKYMEAKGTEAPGGNGRHLPCGTRRVSA